MSAAFNTHPGNQYWNPDADLNNDSFVDIYDAIILSACFGETSDTAYVYQGNIEFFKTEYFGAQSEAQALTDNNGVSSLNWSPPASGTYLVRAKLPSGFNATVNFHSEVTQVNACLSAIEYVSVLKKSVCLTVVSPGQPCTQVVNADADAYISQASDDNHGSESVLQVGRASLGGGPIYESRTLVHFDMSVIPANAYIVSARLDLFGDCDVTPGYGGNVSAFHILQSWSEYGVRWSSCPSCNSTPSCSLELQTWSNKWLSLDVAEDVRHWQSDPGQNFGLLLLASDDLARFMLTLNSREASSNRPGLEVTYKNSSPALVVAACDNVTRKPVGGLNVLVSVDFGIGYLWNFSGTTNESGYLSNDLFHPSTDMPCNVTVSSDETSVYTAGNGSAVLDFRYPANITPMNFANPRSVNVGVNFSYEFLLGSSSLFGLENTQVKFSINGVFVDGTVFSQLINYSTVSDGKVSFLWAAPEHGNYLISAMFDGSNFNRPCQLFVSVSAESKPLAVLFDVSPREFVTGSSVNMNATIIDVETNQRMNGAFVTVEFLRFDSTGNYVVRQTQTTDTGVAVWSDQYPPDGQAYAYTARIKPDAGSLNQSIVTNPVQLTVSKPSQILLNVTRDWSSQNHTIQGWLLSGASGISSRQVKITVNQTDYWSPTNQSGYFSLSLNLLPVDNNATTYAITAGFEDNATQPLNATAWATTLDGQQYPACTTTQYGYKPAYNTTALTISAQSTEIMTATRSPEEMQGIAKSQGWLDFESEFSWGYPFFKLHLKLNTSPRIDVIFAPLALDVSLQINSDAALAAELEDAFSIGSDIVWGMIVGSLAATVTAHLFGRASIFSLFVALAGDVAAQLILAYAANINAKSAKTWLISFFASLLSAGGEAMYRWIQIVKWATSIGRLIKGSIESVFHSWWGSGLSWDIITAIPFMIVDAVLAMFFYHQYSTGVIT